MNRGSWTENSREPVASSRGCLVANRLLAHHGTIVRQVVVIPGKLGGENFANDFSGLGAQWAHGRLTKSGERPVYPQVPGSPGSSWMSPGSPGSGFQVSGFPRFARFQIISSDDCGMTEVKP